MTPTKGGSANVLEHTLIPIWDSKLNHSKGPSQLISQSFGFHAGHTINWTPTKLPPGWIRVHPDHQRPSTARLTPTTAPASAKTPPCTRRWRWGMVGGAATLVTLLINSSSLFLSSALCNFFLIFFLQLILLPLFHPQSLAFQHFMDSALAMQLVHEHD